MRTLFSCSIVLYNNPQDMLQKAVDSVLASQQLDTLYLIDNSPIPLYEDINWRNKKIKYVFTNDNRGYGAGHNIALRLSLEKNIPHHLVLNPDVFFKVEAIEKILDYLAINPKVGNLMPKVYYPDGEVQFLCKLLPTPYDWIGRRFNPLKTLVDKRNERFELRFTGYDKIMEVPYLSGCFMMLNVAALREIGLFDEKIFMYGEETDLCRRLIAGGYSTIFFPEASITHEFAKGSHKSWHLTKIGMQSAVYYFNKWGWLWDSERKKINRATLQKLNYRGKI